MKLRSFTFNPFSENTYVLYDETSEAIIIDPGCLSVEEKHDLSDFITKNSLKPVRLLNTHCHIDHVLGNRFVADKYKLGLEIHALDLPVLHSLPTVSKMYGVPADASPEPSSYLEEGGKINFGTTELEILFCPGHSPGSVVFYNRKANMAVAGDVLFRESIGRSDFPGGDHETLLDSIRKKLFALPDETRIFPGHGPETNIGYEKANNPFLK